ncbi:MAG: hypothetical protein N2055_08685 [Tepidimonas taiwanensis]|nr:hypothetical protein [Tepidimonas taiwanensis]
MSKILTIRIDNDLESRLNRESVATGKSVSQILRDAYLAAQYKDGDSGGLERRIEAIIDQKLNAFHDTLQREIRDRVRVPSFREFRAYFDLEVERIPEDTKGYDAHAWLLRCAKAYWRRYGHWPTPQKDGRAFGLTTSFEWPTSPTKE